MITRRALFFGAASVAALPVVFKSTDLAKPCYVSKAELTIQELPSHCHGTIYDPTHTHNFYSAPFPYIRSVR